MNHPLLSADKNLSILELPSVLTLLFERAQLPLLPGSRGPLGLFVRYLRRKPGRGLAVIYAVDEIHSSHQTRSHAPNRSVSLTIDERMLDASCIRFSLTQTQLAPLEIFSTGVLHAHDLGLSVQTFPSDDKLPALAASCDTSPQSPLFEALQSAARIQLDDPTWNLIAASTQPVRYKPASRCVIRYHLQLERPDQATTKTLILFGKVYSDPEQARRVQACQQRLYEEQNMAGSIPFLPRPLGMIETLGLTLNEAVQVSHESVDNTDKRWDTLRTGTRVFQSQLERGQHGEIVRIMLPEEELRLTAQALVRLHNSNVHPVDHTARTGVKEAKRAKERAELIARQNPAQAETIQDLAQQVASRLEASQPEIYCPAHGGFKASQLLFHSHQVYVVDFDGFCLSDPALDVGYFLAYLRPSALWYNRPGIRQWFEAAANIFRNTYSQAMLTNGMEHTTVDHILNRAWLYEAALLFKIATRRANRLNSPRSQELSAMLSEIASCLAQEARRRLCY